MPRDSYKSIKRLILHWKTIEKMTILQKRAVKEDCYSLRKSWNASCCHIHFRQEQTRARKQCLTGETDMAIILSGVDHYTSSKK